MRSLDLIPQFSRTEGDMIKGRVNYIVIIQILRI
jgi:hypothetical protein